MFGGVGRKLAYTRQESDALVFVPRDVVRPSELQPVFAIVHHCELNSLLSIDPAVTQIECIFGVFRQIVEQHFVFECDPGEINRYILEGVHECFDIEFVVELGLAC